MAHLVFVYGSLLRGLGNHRVIADGELLGEGVTDANYHMVSLGGFPGVIEDGKTAIVGELYRVSDATLRGLDQLEGNGSFYTRVQRTITLTDGRTRTAWIYLLPAERGYLDNDPVETGSWREYHQRTRRTWWHAAETVYTDDEPELDDHMEVMCEGCETQEATTELYGMQLCRDCVRLLTDDFDTDGEVA